MKTKIFGAIAALAMSAVVSTGAANAATQLITNGDFETGDLTGWTCIDANQCEATTETPRTGAYNWKGFENTGFATLTQTINTVAGQMYNFSFWSLFAQPSNPANILRYSLDGGAAVTVANSGSYIQTTDSFKAAGGTAVISFFFETDPGTGNMSIDDVSVVAAGAVPLPASLPLMAFGLGGLGFLARRRRKRA